MTYRARYAVLDGTRHLRTLGTKMDAEAWLASERSLIDREAWSAPDERKAAEVRRQREAAHNTVRTFAVRYLKERGLRPNTVHNYERLLATRIDPYFGEMPLRDVTLSTSRRSSRPTSLTNGLKALKDRWAAKRIQIRLDRLIAGNPGDVRPIGGGISELRIDYGPGYRVYYLHRGTTLVVLLCGGDKATQDKDIKQAHRIAKEWGHHGQH